MTKKRLILVPLWLWNLWFIMELLGAENGWQAIGAVLMLFIPAIEGLYNHTEEEV